MSVKDDMPEVRLVLIGLSLIMFSAVLAAHGWKSAWFWLVGLVVGFFCGRLYRLKQMERLFNCELSEDKAQPEAKP